MTAVVEVPTTTELVKCLRMARGALARARGEALQTRLGRDLTEKIVDANVTVDLVLGRLDP